ncbi:MAG TPA: TrbI/VirB10 family protein [Terriglobales bacterium]|nr:TrbI/VirB10 family protein [Terriglobales bacterium]
MRVSILLALSAALALPGVAQAQNQAIAGQSSELQSIRTAGYNAGFRDGVTDYQNRAPYGFQSHPVYANAAQGYNPNGGVDQQTYEMDFRSGYEAGYDDGFYGRTSNANATRERNYSGAAAQPARPAQQQTTPQYSPNRRAQSGPGTLPAGTSLALKLNNTLSTRSSNPGDTFTAAVTAPAYSQDGQTLLVPEGSTVEGRVASVQRSGGISGNSQIQLTFERLRLPDGSSYPLRAGVSQVNSSEGVGGAITGTPSATNEGGVQQSQTRNTVGTAAAGGAVGAIIGAIAGGGKGAGIGGLVGAGLGVVLAGRNGALDLPAGTPMTITLNSPIQISGQ